MLENVDLLVTNIGQLVTISGPNRPRIREEMMDIGLQENAAMAIRNGNIVATGKKDEIETNFQAKHIVDAEGKLVTPGFVDPHTHPIFAASREDEFAMRVQGATYQEIAKAGGGIRNSAIKVQKADFSTLKSLAHKRLQRFLQLGTTTVEAKSGYGLSTEAEIKSLEVIHELSECLSLDIVPTFMGAHEIPTAYRERRKDYIDLIISEMIPLVSQRKLAQYCDVFCEDHVFTVSESRQILEAGKRAGLLPKVHADELTYTGGAELSAEVKATSAEHLLAVSDTGIQRMQEAGVIAVLLPSTTFFLGLSKYAPARKMISAGVAVALATDFNPGSSMTQNMQFVLTVAAMYLKMVPQESLVATTINSACAIGMQDKVGSLMPGKQADFVLWQVNKYTYLPYHFGDNLVRMVYKRGKNVAEYSQWW